MTARVAHAEAPGSRPLSVILRRNSDMWLAVAVGGIVALLMLALPMRAALASSVVGAFVILAMVDTRVALLSLLLVRSSMDITATVPLLSASGSSDVNAAAMMSLIAIAVGFGHITINRVDLTRIPLAKPLMIFLAVTLLGVGLAPDRNAALQDWIRTLSTFMVYVLVVDLMRARGDMRWLIRVMLLSAIVPIAVGIQQFITGEGNTQSPGLVRIYGTFVHPSPYAFYLVQLLPLALVFFIHTESKFARIILAVGIPAAVFCIYEAQTRGAWVGVVVATMVFLSSRARWTLIFVPLIAGALFFGVPSIRARFNEASESTGSVTWRQEQWVEALRLASPAQLVTVGRGLSSVNVETGNLTHNEYIRLLVETGMAGLVTMFVIYRGLFQLAMKAYRDAPSQYERDLTLAFLMALVSRVVIALSDNIIIYPVLEWYFWAFAGVVVLASGAYAPRALAPPPASTAALAEAAAA